MSKEADKIEKAVARLEKERQSRIFCLIEGAEDHICRPFVLKLWEHRKQFANIETLEVLLMSDGGHASIAYQVATFLRNNCKELRFLVPWSAKSAATLLCLAGDEIVMSDFAELGPLDVRFLTSSKEEPSLFRRLMKSSRLSSYGTNPSTRWIFSRR